MSPCKWGSADRCASGARSDRKQTHLVLRLPSQDNVGCLNWERFHPTQIHRLILESRMKPQGLGDFLITRKALDARRREATTAVKRKAQVVRGLPLAPSRSHALTGVDAAPTSERRQRSR